MPLYMPRTTLADWKSGDWLSNAKASNKATTERWQQPAAPDPSNLFTMPAMPAPQPQPTPQQPPRELFAWQPNPIQSSGNVPSAPLAPSVGGSGTSTPNRFKMPDLSTLTSLWNGNPSKPATSPVETPDDNEITWGDNQAAISPTTPAASTSRGASDGDPLVAAARGAGLDDEAVNVLRAIVKTEGGQTGAVGDNGQSFGQFQFHTAGELPGFAAWLGVDLETAKQKANDHALTAKYAAEGYLGNAIREGQAKGLHGAELATYAQQYGQRSQSPELAGRNYSEQRTAALAKNNPPTAVSREHPFWIESGESLTEDQMAGGARLGLSPNDALAICGPIALAAYQKANGENPDLGEALELAKAVGWSPELGMTQGSAGMVKALNRRGYNASVEPVNWQKVAQYVQAGQPVTINSHGGGGHFWVAQDVRQGPNGIEFDFGNSAAILKRAGGRRWLSPAEMSEMGVGVPSEALYVTKMQRAA